MDGNEGVDLSPPRQPKPLSSKELFLQPNSHHSILRGYSVRLAIMQLVRRSRLKTVRYISLAVKAIAVCLDHLP